MQKYEFDTRSKTKPSLSRQVLERQRDEHEAQGASLPQRGPFEPLISGIGDASSAGVHASMLNRATNGRPSRAGQSLLQLQRQYGNRYVQQVLALAGKGTGEVEAAPALEQSIQTARSSGQLLDSKVQGQMESGFGADFSKVRVHTDTRADMLNRELSARAFTTGQDIFFRQGAYNPVSDEGRHLIAHEATHVVQQTTRPVESTPAWSGELSISRPSDRFEQEADFAASRVAAGETVQVQAPLTANVARDEDDSILGSVWDTITNNALSGGLGLLEQAGKTAEQGSRLSQAGSIAGTAGKILAPLGVVSSVMGIHEAVTGPGTFGLDDLTDTAINSLGLFSSGVTTAGLAGSGLSAVGATGAGGALTAGAAALGPAAAVAGAGAGGYALGRGIDNLADYIGDAVTGNESGDHSLSGLSADAMTGLDQGATSVMRNLGIFDEDRPAYTQTLGWRLAEILPSWLQ